MAFYSFCHKKILLILAAVIAGGSLFAQNGVPLNIMQEDPYFSNGNAEAELKRQEERRKHPELYPEDEEKEPEVQFTDPKSGKFYNAENWDFDSYADLSDEDEQKEVKVEVQKDKEKPHEDVANQINIEWSEEEAVLDNEENTGADRVRFEDSHVIIRAAYSPFYILPMAEKGIDYYFNSPFSFLGFSFGAEYVWGKAKGGFGAGLEADWNMLQDKKTHYSLSTNQFLFNALLYYHFIFKKKAMLSINAGGGVLWIKDVEFKYHSGYTEKPESWIYPEASAGVECGWFLADIFCLYGGLEGTYTFMIERPYAFLQLKAGVLWRF